MADSLRVIDSDTHVDETDETWDYMLPGDEAFKPTTQSPSKPDPNRPPIRYWLIDGKRKHRRIRDDAKAGTPLAARELLDVETRVAHMDELGTEIQVIYPSLFLVEPTTQADVELAVTRSYNRWMADRCDRSKGRLRWIVVPSARNPAEWEAELRLAKDHGACGVLKKGDHEAEKWPSDEYFFPMYQAAEELDLPLCFHLGSGTPDFTSAKELSQGSFIRNKMPAIHGIQSLIVHEIPQRFPGLRFGCIEAGASWVPFVDYDLRRRMARLEGGNVQSGSSYELPDNIWAANRIYITTQVDEDLAYIVRYTGEDNLLAGSDYTHQDQAKELEFPRLFQERADAGDIPQSTVTKILYDNPKAFYGL
jgi:predicted TIM-barrel fold metal-dependent hydrolase